MGDRGDGSPCSVWFSEIPTSADRLDIPVYGGHTSDTTHLTPSSQCSTPAPCTINDTSGWHRVMSSDSRQAARTGPQAARLRLPWRTQSCEAASVPAILWRLWECREATRNTVTFTRISWGCQCPPYCDVYGRVREAVSVLAILWRWRECREATHHTVTFM